MHRVTGLVINSLNVITEHCLLSFSSFYAIIHPETFTVKSIGEIPGSVLSGTAMPNSPPGCWIQIFESLFAKNKNRKHRMVFPLFNILDGHHFTTLTGRALMAMDSPTD